MHRYLHQFFISFVLLSLVMASVFPPQTVSASPLQAPTLTITMTDALIDDGAGPVSPDEDGDGKADPGETIEYTTVINNGSADPATGVTFNNIIDMNTTLVGGSLSISPVAVNDTFPVTVVGNVSIDSADLASPFSVTANDFLGLNPTASIVETNITTSNGGQVIMTTSGVDMGKFTYNPPAGFEGTDQFTYTLTDNANASSVVSNRQATVSITVSGMIWFIDNNAGACSSSCDGRLSSPFTTLAAFHAINNGTGNNPANNDNMFLYESATPYTGGVALRTGQKLIGQDATVSLSAITGLTPPAGSAALPAMNSAVPTAQIQNAGGDGVSVQTNAIPSAIRGLSLSGSNNAIDITVSDATSGTLEIKDNIIVSAGAEGIDINRGGSALLTLDVQNNTWNTVGTHGDAANEHAFDARTSTTGTLNLNFSNNTNLLASNASSSGVFLDGSSGGTLTVTGFASNSVSGNIAGTGVTINTVTFDASAGGSFQQVSGGYTTIGTVGNGVGASGMVLTNVSGNLSFSDLDIVADNGTGLFASGTTTYTGSAGFQVAVDSSFATVTAFGGPAVSLSTVTASLSFWDIDSTNSPTTGVSLVTVAGSFSAGSSSTISNATGTDFSISAGNANVTYNGTITDDVGMLVSIANATGGTKSFTGAISDNNDGDGTEQGISLTNNTGTTITFSGGLAIRTTSNAAFTATGGGTVNVCDENPCNPAATGALLNTLTTTTGTALNVANTTIGSGNLEFRSISANGAASGIILSNTGSGGLKVAGNGGTCTSAANCTGGAIQSTTGAGVALTNASNVSLTRMYISNTGSHGVSGTGMSDGSGGTKPTFAFLNGFMESPGDGDNESALYFDTLGVNNILGTMTVADTTIQNFEDVGIHVGNQSGTLNVNVTNVTVNNNSDTNGEEGIDISAEGTSTINVNVSSSRFQDLEGGSMNIISQGSGTIDLNVDSIVDIGTGGPDNFPTPPAMTFSAESTSSNFFFDITNNKILDASGDGIFIGHEGEISGRITGNIITGIALGDGIRLDTDATGNQTTTFLIQNNQIGTLFNFESVNYSGIGDDGIQILDRDGTKTMNLTIDNNQLANTASEAIRHFADDDVSGGGPTNNLAITGNTLTNIGLADVIVIISQDPGVEVCANISGNTLPASGNRNILLQQSLSAVLRIPQASVAAMAAANTNATSSSLGTINTGVNCTVPTPTNAMLPNSIRVMALDSTTQSSNALTFAVDSSEQPGQIASIESSANPGGGKQVFRPAPAPVQSGETVGPIIIGTLPAGKSVTIKFRVTVNNPTTVGATRILNQGTVSGSNFSNITTTDPSPNADAACSGTSPQTCTAIDRLDASVQSINRSDSSTTNASSVSWLVTSDVAISGLTSSNFTLANTGLGGSPAISSVTPVGATPSTQWTVTASTGTGQGTLGLNLTTDTGLSHDVTNLSFTGQVYTIDKVAPTTTSFTRQNPSAALTNADVLVFRVTFSEAIGGAGGTIGTEDFAVTGTTATLTSVAFVSAGVYDVNISGGDLASFNGTAGLNFSAGMVIRDLAGNDVANSEPSTDETYTVDNAAPSVTLSSAASSSTNANPIPVTVQFSETVSGFSATNIVAGNATVGNFITVDSDTYTFDLTPSSQGLVTADIAAGVATDAIGNGNTAATQFSRTFDSDAPGVTITSAAPDPTNSSPLAVTVQFSENMTGFDASDITLGNATLANFIAVDGDTYTFDLTPSGQGVVTVDIAAGVAQDGSSNGNNASAQFSRTFDTVLPTVTLTSATSDPTNASPILVTAQFSENVTGFVVSDITAGNATIDNFNAVDGDTYTFELMPLGNGLVTADIAAGVATDGANLNSSASQFSRTFDSNVPTVTITSAAPNLTNTSPIPVTVQFSEDVTGFDVGDVTAGNATVGNFVPVDGDTYTFDLTPLGNGFVTADIPAGVAQDSGGNGNSSASQFSRTFDTVAPSVTIDQAVGQADPTGTGPINLTVVFSEPVTGFATGDVDLSASTVTGTLTGTVSGGPTAFNVAVSGMTGDGMVIASIFAGMATDGANLNAASTSTDNSIFYVTNMTEHLVSGNVGVSGAVLSYMDGTPKTATSQADGSYSLPVSFNWTGTVTPTHVCYTFGPVDKSYSNVFTDQTAQDYTPTYNSASSCVDIDISIDGADQGQFVMPPQESAQTSFAGVNHGPVKLESTNGLPFLGAEQVIHKLNGTDLSFSEMMGLPDSQLSTTYWLPWYNNVDLDTQLRFANVSSSTATVRMYVGGVEMPGSAFTLLPGQSARKSFAGVNNGPVQIVSTQNIVVAARVIYKVNGMPTSFSEMMGLPDGQLSTTYWLPWYNNVDLDTQLRIGNASGSTATVRVYVGGIEIGSPFTLLPNQSRRISFAGVNNGPMKIESTQNIVVAERIIYKVNGIPTSYSEMMGLPNGQLDTTHWLPWYNNVDLDTQLRIANVSSSTATVRVYVGGVEISGSPFNLPSNQSRRISLAGVNNGPVKIESTQDIVVAERVIYKANGIPTSFSEMMGLPDSLLEAIYWLPWYNNLDLDTRLRFVVP